MTTLQEALNANGCERLKDFYNVGPVQRAAVESFVAALAQQDLTDEEILKLAHRVCWKYKHSRDPHHSDTYTFNKHTMLDFARAIEKARRQ